MSSKSLHEKVAEWALTGKVGLSSTFMASYLLGFHSDGYPNHPRDGADFERCEGLLKRCPELRPMLSKMVDASLYWAALIPMWDKIAMLDGPTRTFTIRKILDPIESADSKVFRVSPTMTVRFER